MLMSYLGTLNPDLPPGIPAIWHRGILDARAHVGRARQRLAFLLLRRIALQRRRRWMRIAGGDSLLSADHLLDWGPVAFSTC
jgi:hypothetical protein